MIFRGSSDAFEDRRLASSYSENVDAVLIDDEKIFMAGGQSVELWVQIAFIFFICLFLQTFNVIIHNGINW